jgi:cytoskeleton protein RodZ
MRWTVFDKREDGATVQQDRRSKLVASQNMMSSALTEGENPPAAPRAGADLRAARERLGWPIEDVAAALRIRQPHLEALEDGRIDLLPGNAYALGFLRTYAKTLGLDPDEIIRRFKAEAREVNRRTELVFPAPMPERGLPAGAVILLGVVLAIGAYAGWYRLSGQGRLPAETVAVIPQRLAGLADQTVPSAAAPAGTPGSSRAPHAAAVADAGHAAAAAGATTQSDAHAGQPASGAPPQAVATLQPGAPPATPSPAGQGPGAAAPPGAPSAPAGAAGPGQQMAVLPAPAISPTSAAAASVPLAMAPPAAPPPAAPATAVPDPSQVVLKATADAWMQVRDRSGGGVLLNRVLHSGDTWAVPQRPNLVLTTGNAGGTELVVGNVTVQVPGGSGAVRRDLPLDPDLIKDGGFAQLTPPATPGSGGAAAPHAGQSGAPRSADP